MPADDLPGKHIAEELGGRAVAPSSDEERVERERVRNLVQSVGSAYNSLLSRETDQERKTELAAKVAFHDDEFRRRDAMTAEERQAVLRTYPEVLRQLRAELDS